MGVETKGDDEKVLRLRSMRCLTNLGLFGRERCVYMAKDANMAKSRIEREKVEEILLVERKKEKGGEASLLSFLVHPFIHGLLCFKTQYPFAQTLRRSFVFFFFTRFFFVFFFFLAVFSANFKNPFSSNSSSASPASQER